MAASEHVAQTVAQSATEQVILEDCVRVAKAGICERVIMPFVVAETGEFDLAKVRHELAHYKPNAVSGQGLARAFSTLMRQLEHSTVTHLAHVLKNEHAGTDAMAALVDELDVLTPLQGAAPFLHVEVAPHAGDRTKLSLTSFDALKDQTQVSLLLRQDQQGRLVHSGTDTVWTRASNGHMICVGHKDGARTLPLTAEDVAFCRAKGHPFDMTKCA
jgi:hypothetical protein